MYKLQQGNWSRNFVQSGFPLTLPDMGMAVLIRELK